MLESAGACKLRRRARSRAGLAGRRGRGAGDPLGRSAERRNALSGPCRRCGHAQPRFHLRDHFAIPKLDGERFRLAVGGQVERPFAVSLRELHNLPGEPGGDAGMRGQRPQLLRPAGAGRAVGPRRGEHRGVDGRAARRAARPRRPAAGRDGDNLPRRDVGTSPTWMRRSGSSAAYRSIDAGTRCSPMR